MIELLVVVLIIGILAAVALQQYKKAVEKARVAEAKIVLNKARHLHQLYDNFVSDYLQGELPGEYDDDCLTGTNCFKTKNWEYATYSAEVFDAYRNIGDENPYFLRIFYEDGSLVCVDRDSDEYCTMLCGGDGCELK